MRIDPFKVMHWMNIRKLTPGQVAGLSGVNAEVLDAILAAHTADIGEETVASLAEALRIAPPQITARSGTDLAAVVMDAEQVRATCRPIQRAGIHFYNYYSMAAPPGRIAPVILDILCPQEVLPALNNGHLEPAITINLGPGDIYGRWGEELAASTWQVLKANPHGLDRWIVGDSYVEPSYCPHSYARAGDAPARIVSYTGAANLARLLDETNNWTDPAFGRLIEDWQSRPPAATVLASTLRRRGFDPSTAAKACNVTVDSIEAFIGGDLERLGPVELCALGDVLGFDYRVLLAPRHRRDGVGKTCLTAQQCRDTIRPFESYTVASIASAPDLPDLVGMFMLVDGDAERFDLCDHGETHYLVTGGELTLRWRAAAGETASARLGVDGTAWIGAYVEHSWSGRGSVIKLGSGEHLGYLDQFELTNTFAPTVTLHRGRHDRLGWGYEKGTKK